MISGFSSDSTSPKNHSRLTFLRQSSVLKEDEQEKKQNSTGIIINEKELYRDFVKMFLRFQYDFELILI